LLEQPLRVFPNFSLRGSAMRRVVGITGITLLPMTPNWLVDPKGRRLPEASWPSERAAPGDLELVRRFCNTIDRDNGADRFATPDGFDEWLRGEGRTPTRPSRRDFARIVAFREAIHAITRANQEQLVTHAALADVADKVTDVGYRIRATPNGLQLVPEASTPTAVFLGELALICKRAGDDGTLRRLKSCAHCQWTIYDASKNQSGRWCTMSICGARHNARAYRKRHRA
jgi:predicted RNA-binding Zn ribbon-like protein